MVTENDDIIDRTTCPAVIFAARRNLSVTGRTEILIDSIIIKNGFSQVGALSGRRCPIVIFIENVVLLIINIIHVGILNEVVIMICLVILNIYGSIPIIFI